MANSAADPSFGKPGAPPDSTAVLAALASIASTRMAAQLEAFTTRLIEALAKAGQRPAPSADSEACAHAAQHLGRNRTTFHRLISTCLAELLRQELDSGGGRQQAKPECNAMDLSLVTFEAMEQKVLIDNLSHALAAANTEPLDALSLRIAHLMRRQDAGLALNPFRPDVFLRAVSDAWGRFDLNGSSHLAVLRQMRPEIFPDLEPILRALNDALVERNILPTLSDAYRFKKAGAAAERAGATDRRHLPLYSKLNRWLSSADAGDERTGPGGGNASVHPGLSLLLDRLQKQAPAAGDTSILRRIRLEAPPGTLSQADANALELLARTLERIFEEPCIPGAVKTLMSQLQIPLLKAALSDRDFFFREDHPARRLIDTVARTSVACDPEKGGEDPLFKMIEQIVERVQRDYDREIGLFDDVINELESFIEREAAASDDALAAVIVQAARQEKIIRAKELAEKDVTARVESGEAAGFIEVFLETQWLRVLGLAHSVEDTKPEAIANAIRTMDELIWSATPKATPQERKELLGKLPSLLANLNAWLNAVKWDGPDRVKFFSALAERHAAMVRTAAELSPRAQLEFTMNVAQKASEWRLKKHEVGLPEQIIDESVHLVDGLEPGCWIEFMRNHGTREKSRLAWISPRRSRFAFANRQGLEPFALTFDELAQAFRHGRACVIAADSVSDRALAAALDEVAGEPRPATA
jgi:hypothetical protein